MAAPRLVMLTRYPEPGAAKTRLIGALGAAGAADLHRRLAERTAAAMRASGLPGEIRGTGAPPEAFRRWLGDGFVHADQGDGDLGARMRRAADPAPAILIGADCPEIDAARLRRAAAALDEAPVVIGPAEDGGYWLIGLARPAGFLFDGMAWGTAQVLSETLARLAARGISPALLETLADCDRPEDLARWPDLVA